MGFEDGFRFRDCVWCGVRFAQMTTVMQDKQTRTADLRTRTWACLSCPQCGNLTVLETNAAGEEPHRVLREMPEPGGNVNVRHLPDDVEGYYRDAVRILDVGVPDAAAVQLRRTLEAAAAHFDVDRGSLVTRIRKLIELGLVTKPFSAILHHVRQVGNVGAHATDQRLDEETVRRALDFTTQVLRNLFEIPKELTLINGDAPDEADDAEATEGEPD